MRNDPSSIARLAITSGEPAGIGPDIILTLAQYPLPAHIVVFADPNLLEQRAAQLSLSIQLHTYSLSEIKQQQAHRHQPGHLDVIPISLSQPVISGQLNPANATYVLKILRQAGQACFDKQFDALVTAPVHKSVINEAGILFRGHTEFFAALTNV